MNDFIHSNKLTGIYWLNKSMKKLKIKINLKPVGGIISLPKFENHPNEAINTNPKLEHDVEEHVFDWQEKKFSTWEISLYGNSLNCVTDTELAYHDMIKNQECTPYKVFSYIHEDNYMSLPLNYMQKSKTSSQFLSTIVDHMLLKNETFPIFGWSGRKSDSALQIFKSEERVHDEDEEWTAMHIIYDNSEYDEYSQLLSKQEAILISLYHNTLHNYLIISPDSNNLEFNPYEVMTASGIRLQYHYEVDISFDDDDSGEELMILMKRLYKKTQKKQRHLVKFVMPPVGVKKYYLTMEIMTAAGFEMDNLYIEYHLKVPDGARCKDTLHGKTHTSKSMRVDQLDQCNFGHILELELEVNTALGLDLPQIKIFIEVISIDWWRRHRTEGYSYYSVSLTPGRYSKRLSCSKPEEMNVVESKSRWFFVGGCHLIKDLEVLAKPQLMDANFTYETTGTVEIQWNVISQRSTPGSSVSLSQPGAGTASALLVGAETALRKYSKARAKLAAATKDLDVSYAMDDAIVHI